jgi:D-beta-D-heptose 7-phosphate kinase/D-beta-D-heptose 1-phosphate adenosyltransferase
MLDRYRRGEVRRISPETPVPIVRLRQRDCAIGGTANVAGNLATLGLLPTLIGVLGADEDGQ